MDQPNLIEQGGIHPGSIPLPPGMIGSGESRHALAPGRFTYDVPPPEGFKPAASSPLVVPERMADGIVLPDRQSAHRPDNRQDSRRSRAQTEKSSRSQQERILAMHDIRAYLAHRAKEDLKNPHNLLEPLVQEVCKHLAAAGEAPQMKEPTDPFSPHALSRRITERQQTDRLSGQKLSYTASTPGAVERVACIAIREASDDFIRQAGKTEAVIESVRALLAAYRLNATASDRLPEMPDAAALLLEFLQTSTRHSGATSPKTRYAVYDTLAEMRLPSSMQEELFAYMERQQDYEHPMAADLELSLLKKDARHPVLQAERERRTQLLHLLASPAQEAFDNYAAYDAAARQLTLNHDFSMPEGGKVGMEIEFVCQSAQREIPEGWTVGVGGTQYFELRKADTALSFNRAYAESCAQTAQWLRDCARNDAMTMHVHLDRSEHPSRPVLGGLLAGDVDGKNMIQENDLGTWEVRANTVPMTPRGISLPSLLGLLDLYRLTAADTAKHDTRRLTLTGSKSYAQLVWGHLCANFTDPAIRLAALFALRYPRAFRTVNSIALLASYEDDAAKPIWSILKREGIVSGTQDAEYDIPALLGHTDTDIVIATIDALGERLHQFPESVHAVNNLLRHTNTGIVIATIDALGERLHEFPESVHAVNKLLRHTNMDIVITTIRALGERVRNAVFREALAKLRDRSQESPDFRSAYQLAMIRRSRA